MFKNFEDLNRAWNAVEQQRFQENFLGAYDSYVRILVTLHAQGLPQWSEEAVATIIQATADLALVLGDFDTPDQLFESLVYLYEVRQNHPLAFFTILKRIHLALERGLFDPARKLFQSLIPQIGDIEEIDISPSGLIQWEEGCFWKGADLTDRSVLFAQLYFAMGRYLSAHGQYAQSLLLLKRGLLYTGADAPALARQLALPIHFSIVAGYLEQGKLIHAARKLTDLQAAFDPDLQPELKIRWLELMAKISLLRGDLGEALRQFELVQEICRRLKLPRAIILSTINLVSVLIFVNQTSLAKDYLIGVLSEKLTQKDSELRLRIELLLQLADARSQSLFSDISGSTSVSRVRSDLPNSSNDSIDVQLEDINFSIRSSNYLALFEFRSLQFYWFLSHRKMDLAERLLNSIQSVFKFQLEPRQGSDSELIQVKINILLGTLTYYQAVESNNRGGLVSAASILDEVRLNLERMGLKPELWGVQRLLGWCWSRLNIREPQAKIIELNNILLDELTQSLKAEDRAIYLLNKWTADEEYIAGKINYIQRLRQAKPILSTPWRYWQSMQCLHRLLIHIDQYKDALAKRNLQNQNKPIGNKSVYSLWKRVSTHPRDRITLVFLVLPDRVLIVRIGWLLLDFQVISTTRLKLRELVQNWHGKIQDFNRGLPTSNPNNLERIQQDNHDPNRDVKYDVTFISDSKKYRQQISQQISEILKFDSLLKRLPKRIKYISIVPDDILHGFPFASIVNENKYLIEKYSISISYESLYIDKPKSSLLDGKLLLVGVSQGNKDFIKLQNVKSEIAEIERWMKQNHFNPLLLLNDKADKATTIKKLKTAELFHVACHGIFVHGQPELSGLVLIPKPTQPAEILSLKELSKLDLSELRHATLSSCWSADHYVLPGRWIISLPETLWRSGTESILGCLWEVNDFAAVTFMTRFYQYLGKYSRDKALQLTQQDCLKGNLKDNLLDPLYWSGFTLYGSYKKLDLLSKISKNNNYYA